MISPPSFASRLRARRFPLLLFPLLLTGCNRAPAISVLGSFFPAWLLCLLISILLAALVHLILQRTPLAGSLQPPVLVYPCLVAVFTMSLWLIFYS